MAGKMCVFCGSDQPQKAFPPFMLGAGALAMDMEVMLFFTMDGLNIVRRGGADQIPLEGTMKTLPQYIQLLKDGGAKLVACSAAFPIVKCTENDLIDGVECGGIAGFLAAAEKADILLTFA
jgi:predicted peroxiredoxin